MPVADRVEEVLGGGAESDRPRSRDLDGPSRRPVCKRWRRKRTMSVHSARPLSRRSLLGGGLATLGVVLAACAPAAPPTTAPAKEAAKADAPKPTEAPKAAPEAAKPAAAKGEVTLVLSGSTGGPGRTTEER